MMLDQGHRSWEALRADFLGADWAEPGPCAGRPGMCDDDTYR